MFPHTVTVFNVVKNDGKITYHKNIIKDVFYQIDKKISEENKGEKTTNFYDVIFSVKALEKWLSSKDFIAEENTYTLRENDIVVLDEYKDIKDLIEIQKDNVDYFLIKSVSENLYGDRELWNIEVTN